MLYEVMMSHTKTNIFNGGVLYGRFQITYGDLTESNVTT